LKGDGRLSDEEFNVPCGDFTDGLLEKKRKKGKYESSGQKRGKNTYGKIRE